MEYAQAWTDFRHLANDAGAHLGEPGLKPHRIERYTVSNDPNFEAKAPEAIGLYLSPPAHASVFCVDEKPAI